MTDVLVREPSTELEPEAQLQSLLHPWERQVKETARAHAAFTLYRDMGPKRSLVKAARGYYEGEGESTRAIRGKVPQQFGEWSRRNRWVSRAAAYDKHLDEERVEARVDAIRAMEIRHANIGLKAQSKGLEALELLDLAKFEAGDVIRFLVEGVKIERLARGASRYNEDDDFELGGGPRVSVQVTTWAATDPRQQLMEHLIALAEQEIAQKQSLERVIDVGSAEVATGHGQNGAGPAGNGAYG